VAQSIQQIRLASPFLLRTAEPSLTNLEGRIVRELRRIGKRIAIGVEGDLWLVLHLMIAGRLHWRPPGAKLTGRQSRAAFDFSPRFSRAHRSWHKASRIAICLQWRAGPAIHRSWRNRRPVQQSQLVSRRAGGRKPHPQAGPHRSPHTQRHRQRLFGRDFARCPIVSNRTNAKT